MANTVKLKRSGTASASPSSLEYGEIAINYADGKIYWKNSSNSIQSFSLSSSSATANIARCDGRLTLESGVPVSSANQSAKSTLYFTPVIGNVIALYSGTAWAEHTFTELSLALSSLTSGKNYDVFVYDNSGTKTLELTAWTNDSTRATALTTQDGVLVKSGATTRRYVGTIRTTGTTTTEDSNTKRFVWNLYNQAARDLFSCPAYSDGNTQTSYTLSATSWTELNGGTGSKVEWVQGRTAASLLGVQGYAATGGTGNVYVGLGVDSTTTAKLAIVNTSGGTLRSGVTSAAHTLAEGYHYGSILGVNVSVSQTTWYADEVRRGGSADTYTTFIFGQVAT